MTSISANEIENRIREILFIVTQQRELLEINRNHDLFESSILDSFSVLELIVRIEQVFDIKISAEELELANLSSISGLTQFLLRF